MSERDALAALETELRKLADTPDGAVRVEAALLSSTAMLLLYRADAHGAWVSADVETMGVYRALKRAREAMYVPGAGTWISMDAVVSGDRPLKAHFDDDHEPAWDAPVDPLAYVADLTAFPRDEANRPEWLKARVAQARARS